VPLIQLFIFGYALNANPRHLQTGLLIAGESHYARAIEAGLVNTGYFDLRRFDTEAQAEKAIVRGDVQFVLNVPPGFDRDVDRGHRPAILMDADATDPTAIGNATAALTAINNTALTRDLPPNLRFADSASPPFEVRVHARYNPETITALNVVPGLIGIILTLSTLVITALAITREQESGTLENLLAMPVRPLEIMLGKIVPYVGLGYVQVALVLVVANVVFHVPERGSPALLLLALGIFIACNLAMGFTISTLVRTQLQALQLAQGMLLPSILLSGFIYPIQGMPAWAKMIGEILPATHIMRICRGILLKGSGLADIAPDLWPMALFALVVGAIAVRSFRRTLD
jgi:ABC-2 type transport system permease protein